MGLSVNETALVSKCYETPEQGFPGILLLPNTEGEPGVRHVSALKSTPTFFRAGYSKANRRITNWCMQMEPWTVLK